jgi:hypothetical protein
MTIGIRFIRRRNLGSFEHTEIELTDAIQDGANKVEAVKNLMTFAHDALFEVGDFAKASNSPATAAIVAATMAKTPVTKAPATKVVAAEKVEEAVIENSKQGELPLPESKPLNALANLGTEAPKEEAKKEVAAKPTAKKETVIKAKATKVTNYDRALDAHKNNLGLFLDGKFPTWRKPENLPKAGKASRELQDTPFLDVEGNILDTFKEAFCAHMVDLV